MAEREGFEPPGPLRAQRFSRPPQSTTLPPLRSCHKTLRNTALVELSRVRHARSVAYEKHLLVDGANVLHAWPDLRALAARDKDAARAQLSQALRVLHDAEGWRVTLVFDGRGPELTVEQPGGDATFAHVFTPSGMTADDAIEQLVGGAADPAACTVATADRAEQQTVAALGAAWCSPDDLHIWCDRAATRQTAKFTEMNRANNRVWRRP
jgi:uncharacterized protein